MRTIRKPSLIVLLFLWSSFVLNAVSATIEYQGIVYRSVTEVASKLGMKSEYNTHKGTQKLTSKWTEINFKNNSKVISVNGIKVYLGYPVITKHDRLFMPELDWQFTLSPILVPSKISTTKHKLKTIVIDPGHGGKDPGARNSSDKIKEKELTLAVSKTLSAILRKKGYRVYLTRSKDQFIKLSDRARFSNRKKADLFISIHFNASSNSDANGIETYAYTLLNQPSSSRNKIDSSDKIFRKANRNDSKNVLLSYNIQKQLIDRLNERDRGVKRARFTVLENLQCPGTLIELGFVNNPPTAKKLKNSKYINNLAQIVAEGIYSYEGRLKKSK